jgi:hypothetical protein
VVACLQDGMTWLMNSPEQDLPLILADNGYDVWIANTRGTRHSRRHVSLYPSNKVTHLFFFTQLCWFFSLVHIKFFDNFLLEPFLMYSQCKTFYTKSKTYKTNIYFNYCEAKYSNDNCLFMRILMSITRFVEILYCIYSSWYLNSKHSL